MGAAYWNDSDHFKMAKLCFLFHDCHYAVDCSCPDARRSSFTGGSELLQDRSVRNLESPVAVLETPNSCDTRVHGTILNQNNGMHLPNTDDISIKCPLSEPPIALRRRLSVERLSWQAAFARSESRRRSQPEQIPWQKTGLQYLPQLFNVQLQ